MIATRIRLAAAVLSVVMCAVKPAIAEPDIESYTALWRQASVALVDFAMIRMDRRMATSQAARALAYRRARDRFETAVVKLVKTSPPPELTSLHWKLVPLHEELVAALSTIVEGAEKNDSTTMAVGWFWADQAQSMIEKVVRDSRDGGGH